MYKRFLTVLCCFFVMVSCDYFNQQSRREPIQEVDTIVDFKTVDAFPLFPNCKDIPSREKQQICFQLEMSQHIYAFLKQYEYNVKEIVNDTVLVKLKIDSGGITSLSSIQISDKTRELLPEFDSILKLSLQNLPVLQPAIKRAIPVTTEFVLPIILKI